MSSASDSETEWESRYEIHDVPDDARFSECEDGWADDEGDEVATVNILVNQQEGEQCDQFESHTNIHGNSGTDQEGTNYRGLKSMDIVGKEFVSEAEAESFFIEYARVMGFGVRRHNKRWNTKGMLIGRIWVCSKQGFRQKKFLEREDRKREARPITRTGCGVEFRVAIKDDTSRWVCTHFNGNHNHNLTPPHHVHYIRSHRRLSEADIAAASSLNAVGVEGKDDYDSKEARPVLITHMKPFEAAAAEAYTRAMFRLVRDQILQEGMLIAVEVASEDNSKSFRVKKWKVSEDECRVHIQGTWDTVSCTCLMMETVGIPCSHLFAVMKVENLEAIPRCMILPRWKKEAKVGVTSEVQERCSQHYMSVEARMGSLHAACRTLQRFAAQSSQAYELAITEIHKVSMQLEAMSCETATDKPKRHMGRRFEVQDPVIVLTKGCRKKQKMDPPQQRKCRRCGNGGHTVRTCKTHLHRPGDEIDCPTQSSQFMADNTVLLRRRRSAIGKTTDECNRINAYDHHYSQPSNNSHAASSNSWYPRFGMSTDNDSTDDTMMQGLIPQYVLPNASTSTFASNYANIWGHNRI
ncbi:hypothetical protein WN944_007770 [Citrus x changshan-huyou]|uniref:Protein FAR1-RELATED SEQUENCE n=1 Tax=Citrus x changshan-huyou TaxID=2935761 RepID=A0AAP0MLP8_9ROSI